MYDIKAFEIRDGYGIVEPLSIKRKWMDDTWEAHAYKCFPVGLTNQLGWSISFPEDISFIWDGISDASPDHVKILSGEKYAYSGRANGTISFNTGLMFNTEESLTMLSMPVPNLFIDGAVPFTTLISTSFFRGELPVAWMITKPNEVITIKAGTPIITILPINLEELQGSEINFEPMQNLPESQFDSDKYSEIIYDLNRSGTWSNFYRDAVDHLKNSIGKHQVKALRLSVNPIKSKK
jgi:Family of unknown function (DUF6065)